MVAMIMPNKSMADSTFDKLLNRLRQDFGQLRFRAGPRFCWSPGSGEVIYKQNASSETAAYSLLHETGHGLLGHNCYQLDFELVAMEVAAWEKARQLAIGYGVALDENHVQDCLDSYRDWLYRRSVCPSCTNKALQVDNKPEYRCFNCQTSWRVAASRFCRTYRQTQPVNQQL